MSQKESNAAKTIAKKCEKKLMAFQNEQKILLISKGWHLCYLHSKKENVSKIWETIRK